MRRGILVATAVVSCVMTVPVYSAEPPVRGEIRRPGENGDERLHRFVDAYRAVESIRRTAERTGGGGARDILLARMEAAIRDAGLSVEEYESIAMEARFDQRVRDRVFRILNRQGGTEGAE